MRFLAKMAFPSAIQDEASRPISISTSFEEHDMEPQPQEHGHHDITVIVFAPRSPHPKEFTWPRTLKVGDAARQAATAFGYQAGNPGLQTEGHHPRVLDNSKTLAEEHVENGEKLELIDTGGGV
jgi:hypothetical protein